MTLRSNAHGGFRYEDTTDEGINMLDLKIDLKMDTNSFTFGGSQSLSSSCPSTAGSFSSASSHYDPYTPTSRTSTPQQPINFDTYDNESIMFDFTPPSSATTGYFPLDALKPTVAPTMLSHGMPSTPSRCNNIFDTGLSFHDSLNFNPHQDLDAYNFADALGSSPFLIPTPSTPFSSGTLPPSCDMASVWGQHVDGSPITFSSPAAAAAPLSTRTSTSTPLGSSHGNVRRRVALDGPQQSSAMLQQHLQTPTKTRPPKPRGGVAGKPGTAGTAAGQRGYRVSKELDMIPRGKYKCDECNGKIYSRAEHLKRHKTEAHSSDPPKWTCEYCPKKKVFGRSDNFRDHLKRHVQKSTGSRTKPDAGAAALLAKMQGEMKTKKRRGGVVKAEPAAMSRAAAAKSVKAEPLSPPLSSPLL